MAGTASGEDVRTDRGTATELLVVMLKFTGGGHTLDQSVQSIMNACLEGTFQRQKNMPQDLRSQKIKNFA